MIPLELLRPVRLGGSPGNSEPESPVCETDSFFSTKWSFCRFPRQIPAHEHVMPFRVRLKSIFAVYVSSFSGPGEEKVKPRKSRPSPTVSLLGCGYCWNTAITAGSAPGPKGQEPIDVQLGSILANCWGDRVTTCVGLSQSVAAPAPQVRYWTIPFRRLSLGTIRVT